jgi:hypothetical protein
MIFLASDTGIMRSPRALTLQKSNSDKDEGDEWDDKTCIKHNRLN